MNARERFVETMTFGNPDRIPLNPGYPRISTLERWHQEGLPMDVNYMDYLRDKLNLPDEFGPENDEGFFCNMRMNPLFEEKILEHKNNHYIAQDWIGTVVEISDKFDCSYLRSGIDFVTRKYIRFPVQNREDWEQMKTRYVASDPIRLPENLEAIGRKLADRRFPLTVTINGVFWQVREWLGFEDLCMAMIEDPDWVHEMCDFWGDYVTAVLQRMLPYVRPDYIHISEDMAYKAHAMISPEMTREFLMPNWQKWTRLLKSYNVPVTGIDSDGYIEGLIPLWIESGVNACDPWEAAAENDIVACRKLYGRQIAFSGGVDKRLIAAGGQALRNEIKRITPVVESGGYIPSCDHGVPPDISLANFVDYTEMLAKITGWL